MANEHLNLRDDLEGDEQYQVMLGRMAAVVTARQFPLRANPDARDADALFITGVLDLDGVASFDILDAGHNTRVAFNYESGEIAKEARAHVIDALSKCTSCEGQLADDFGNPRATPIQEERASDTIPVFRLRAVED